MFSEIGMDRNSLVVKYLTPTTTANETYDSDSVLQQGRELVHVTNSHTGWRTVGSRKGTLVQGRS